MIDETTISRAVGKQGKRTSGDSHGSVMMTVTASATQTGKADIVLDHMDAMRCHKVKGSPVPRSQ